jgi:hypothetical protein
MDCGSDKDGTAFMHPGHQGKVLIIAVQPGSKLVGGIV